MRRHLVVLLVDVTIEDRHVLERHQELDGLRAIARGPIPFRRQIEKRPVREHDDRRILVSRSEVSAEPGELLVADLGARV